MKIEKGITASNINLAVLFAGLACAYIIWLVISGRVNELQYEYVLGEVGANQDVEVSSDRLRALPIVQVRTSVDSVSDQQLSDKTIEDAFREPVFAAPIVASVDEPAQEETEQRSESPVDQMFLYHYRPLVGALTSNGAVINGNYWAIGEELRSMPMPSTEGDEPIYATLSKVDNNSVTLVLAGKTVRIKIQRN